MGNKYSQMIREEINSLNPYIPGKPIEEVQEEYGLEKVIKLASNENPLGLSEKVKNVIINELTAINRYPDGDCRLIKRAVAKKLNVSEDMLLFGNGSDGLLKVIAETFINKGDEVIIFDPSFVEYSFTANLMGADLKRIKMNPYHQDLDSILQVVSDKTKMVFLTSPHNPAGTIITDEQLRLFLDRFPDNTLLIMDEAYYEYVQSDEYPDSLEYIKKGYPLIVLRTFSKVYGLAGLRMGYLIADSEIVSLVAKALDPFNVNRISQAAALAALEDEEFIKNSIRVNEAGKEYLYKELEKRNITYVPTEANFILINMGINSMEVFDKLLRMGVIIRPGKPLGYPDHIRLSIGTEEENKIFINSIDKLLAE